MSEVIVVTSGKGGVGKTTTSANVGTGLAEMGKSVVLIDADIGLRNLDVVMGLENRIVYNLVDVIEGNCRLKQALIKDKRHAGLYLMPAAQTRDKNCITPGQMVKLTDSLREQFDYIILDCPAGIEQGFQNAIAGADRAIVVTTPEVSGYLFNAAYLRLKTLALGYTLPKAWVNKAKLSNVRLSISGYNLFEITQIPDLYDPDQISSAYPMMRSVAFGLQVGF